MRRAGRAFVDAMRYFSVVPLPGRAAGPPGSDALVALPAVGAAIGLFAGSAAWGVARVAPRPLGTAAAFVLPTVLSGAIHLDGFLDCCDAAFASVPPERRREILKDPCHGTYAMAGYAIVACLSWSALSALRPVRFPFVLAFAGGLGRLAAVAGALWFPYPGTSPASSALARRPSRSALGLQVLGVFALCARAAPEFAPAVPAALVLGYGSARFLSGRFGGLSGDAYGCTIVAVESALLVAASVIRERRGP